MDNTTTSRLFEGKLSGSLVDELLFLAKTVGPSVDLQLIAGIHGDLVAFYSGAAAGFQRSDLPYHNLRHCQMVVLATMRLFDGLHSEGRLPISPSMLLRGYLAASFHDTGMLLTKDDPAQSGTDYMFGHEARSALFLKHYAARKGLTEELARDCAIIIKYTDMKSDPATFEAHSQELQLVGQVVGSADILAQMADRYYLECLPRLFVEQRAGGVCRHETALELMKATHAFYHQVVLARLNVTFSRIATAMQTHFRRRYNIDRNLYFDNIERNIGYLESVIEKCSDIECFDQYLKRRPPST